VSDSLSGEKLGLAVRKIPDKILLQNDKRQVKVEMMQVMIDEKAADTRVLFDKVLK